MNTAWQSLYQTGVIFKVIILTRWHYKYCLYYMKPNSGVTVKIPISFWFHGKKPTQLFLMQKEYVSPYSLMYCAKQKYCFVKFEPKMQHGLFSQGHWTDLCTLHIVSVWTFETSYFKIPLRVEVLQSRQNTVMWLLSPWLIIHALCTASETGIQANTVWR